MRLSCHKAASGLMTEYTERRRDRRLDLSLPIEFTVSAEAVSPLPRTGLTRNVSSGGVYFETTVRQSVLADAPIKVRIAIPRTDDESTSSLSLQGEARVVRVDHLRTDTTDGAESREVWGVAVVFCERPNVRLFSLNDLFWEQA